LQLKTAALQGFVKRHKQFTCEKRVLFSQAHKQQKLTHLPATFEVKRV